MEVVRSRRPLAPTPARLLRLAAALIALAAALALAHRLGLGGEWLALGRDALTRVAVQTAAQLTAAPERLQIDIAHQNFEKLAFKRQTALAEGMLVSSPEDFVPARIRHGDREVRVKLRLKGDMSDHWEDETKWSFRVVVKDPDTLFGMKQLSLQHPRTRDFASEWVMHAALRREGLPALRYDFVNVVLNGKDLGIYALEEHFEKRLVEHADRREGPIVRFNEDLCWGEIRPEAGLVRSAACLGSGAGSYLAADVDAFHTNRLLQTDAGYRHYLKALQLLEAFRRGELPTSQVFDAELLARYFAVLELLDRVHASYWRNARFYYNPITSRLEPIAFDGGSTGQPGTDALVPALRGVTDTRDRNAYYYHLHYFDSLFADRDFYARYVRELERVSSPSYLTELLEELRPELERVLRILHTEFPDVRLDEPALRERARFIGRWLAPPKLVHAHLQGRRNGHVRVAVGNLQYLDVEVTGLRDGRGGRVALPEPLRLPGRSASQPVEYRELEVPLPPDFPEQQSPAAPLNLEHRILGSGTVRETPLFAWPQAPVVGDADVTRAAPNAREFDFIVEAAEGAELRILPGSWFLRRDLIAPRGVRLRAGPGTELILEDGALILSRGPVEWVGSEEAPVVVRSVTGSGQGLVVLEADGPSRLEHVRFENLSAPDRDGLGITGAVTFYASPVSFGHCAFEGSRAEDALNLVRSPFEIRDCVFRGSASDALDVDFGEGVLADAAFVDSGNDAVDLSGSVVEIEHVRVVGAGDKGLSVGERSDVRGRDLRVRGAALGVASKDLSNAQLEDVQIAEARVGLAAYQKKSEFGGGRLAVSGLALSGVATDFLAEAGSELLVEGSRIEQDTDRVRRMLDGVD